MKKKMESLFTFLVVLLPFLYQYKSPVSSISFGEFVLVPLALFFLFIDFKGTIRYLPFNGMYTYFGIALLMTLFAAIQPHFSFSSFITVFLRIIYYSILIYVAYQHFNIDYALKIAINLAILFSLYALLQFTVHRFSGIILPTVIFKAWVFEAEAGLRLDYESYYRWTYRSSSLFLEPSYFAAFCSVGLSSSLFSLEENKNNFFKSLIISLGIVVSTSSAGLVILIINWFAYFYKMYFKSKRRITYKALLITITFVGFAIYVFSSSLAETLLARTATGGSFGQRVMRGFIISEHMNFQQKLIGVGINNLGDFVKYNGIITKYDEGPSMLNYASSMIGTYICSGIITLLFYLRFYIKSWFKKNNDVLSRVLILTLLFLSMIEMNSYTYRFAYFVIFIFALQRYISLKE